MAMFIKAIKNTIQSQTLNQPQEVDTLTLRYIQFQKIQPETKLFLQRYSNLRYLEITHCDLRTLHNFPNLVTLVDLRLAHNKLQGSLENIIKLMGLQYLDLSSNIIRDPIKLLPLKRIKGLALHVKNNPFEKKDSWKGALNAMNLKIENQPRKNPLELVDHLIQPTSLKKQEKPFLASPVLFREPRESFRERIDKLDRERAILSRELRRTKLEFGRALKVEEIIEDRLPVASNIDAKQSNFSRRLFQSNLSISTFTQLIKFQDDRAGFQSTVKEQVKMTQQMNADSSLNYLMIKSQSDNDDNNHRIKIQHEPYEEQYSSEEDNNDFYGLRVDEEEVSEEEVLIEEQENEERQNEEDENKEDNNNEEGENEQNEEELDLDFFDSFESEDALKF